MANTYFQVLQVQTGPAIGINTLGTTTISIPQQAEHTFFIFWPYFSPRRRWPPEWAGNAIGCTFPLSARLAFYCVTGSRADGQK